MANRKRELDECIKTHEAILAAAKKGEDALDEILSDPALLLVYQKGFTHITKRMPILHIMGPHSYLESKAIFAAYSIRFSKKKTFNGHPVSKNWKDLSTHLTLKLYTSFKQDDQFEAPLSSLWACIRDFMVLYDKVIPPNEEVEMYRRVEVAFRSAAYYNSISYDPTTELMKRLEIHEMLDEINRLYGNVGMQMLRSREFTMNVD